MAERVPNKILLSEDEMPTQWYNIVPDLPAPPPPPLHPGTLEPAGPDDFAPLFPMALIEQEVPSECYIDIPDPIHAGGLRYHGMSPLVSHIDELGLAEATAIPQIECFTAALQFARTEGIVPAPEPTHAMAEVPVINS
jgi:predicted alternative tryptophan synthase beta-subunit